MKKIKSIILFVIIGFVFLISCVLNKNDSNEGYHYLKGIDFDIYKSDSVIFHNSSYSEMVSKIHSINKTKNHYFVLDYIFNQVEKSYWQVGFNSLENRKIKSIKLFIKSKGEIIEISETLSPYNTFDTLVYCENNQLNMGSGFKFLTNKFNRISRGDGDFHTVDYVDMAIPLNLNSLDLEDKIEITIKVVLEGKTFTKTKVYNKK